jgi:hypothetical protein
MAFAHHYGAASREGVPPEGSAIAIVIPVVVPKKMPIYRRNAAGSGRPRPFGGSNGLACLNRPPSGLSYGGRRNVLVAAQDVVRVVAGLQSAEALE